MIIVNLDSNHIKFNNETQTAEVEFVVKMKITLRTSTNPSTASMCSQIHFRDKSPRVVGGVRIITVKIN